MNSGLDFDNVKSELEKTLKNLILLKTARNEFSNSRSQSTDATILNLDTILEIIDENSKTLQQAHIPSSAGIKNLQQRIEATSAMLEHVNDKSDFPTANLNSKVEEELSWQLAQLKEMKSELENCEKPNSYSNYLKEKKLYVDAACAVFQSLIEDVPDKIKGYKQRNFSGENYDKNKMTEFNIDARALLDIFQKRRKALEDFINSKGRDLASFYDNPFEETDTKLLKEIEKKFSGKFIAFPLDKTAPEKDWIPAVIDAFLDKYRQADSRSGKRLLRDAKSHVLNEQRNWDVIESEFLVPVSASSSSALGQGRVKFLSTEFNGTSNAKIKTVTTPVGHLFDQDTKDSIGGGWADIVGNSLDDYQKTDPAKRGRTISAGRNSHTTTEHLHGVNVARTEIIAGKDTLFSGTRHATLSAYDMYPDNLKKMSNKRLEKIAKDLLTQTLAQRSISNPNASDLDKEWNKATEDILPQQTSGSPAAVSDKEIRNFIKKATSDEKFCALLRRKAALNRAREVFLSEALGNPSMAQRIAANQPVHFNSVSLITPDPLRNFLARLIPSKYRRHDELTMRREEARAWKDLQQELDLGRCEINGKVVMANIHSFSIGVNQLSLQSGSKLSRALTSGWNTVEEDNRQALTALIGNPEDVVKGTFDGQVSEALAELVQRVQAEANEQARNDLIDQIEQVKTLAKQLAEMWESGNYRHSGDQPYKFAARVALLSSLMNGGTAFNCKSGKDRCAHLDLEVKLLAVQCRQRSFEGPLLYTPQGKMTEHPIPPPYAGRTDLDRYQMLALIFKDKTRTEMQRYNTGVQGSKLNYWRELYQSFIPAEEPQARWIGEQFRGRSMEVAS